MKQDNLRGKKTHLLMYVVAVSIHSTSTSSPDLPFSPLCMSHWLVLQETTPVKSNRKLPVRGF